MTFFAGKQERLLSIETALLGWNLNFILQDLPNTSLMSWSVVFLLFRWCEDQMEWRLSVFAPEYAWVCVCVWVTSVGGGEIVPQTNKQTNKRHPDPSQRCTGPGHWTPLTAVVSCTMQNCTFFLNCRLYLDLVSAFASDLFGYSESMSQWVRERGDRSSGALYCKTCLCVF